MRTRSTSLTVAVATLLALSACSGSDPSGDVSPHDRLVSAKKTLDDASSVHLLLTSKDVPKGVDGLVGADGEGTHAPAFKGSLKARIKGLSANVPVVAVDGDVWIKLPFTKSYTKADPADYHAPDPAALFSTDRGVTNLLTATKDPTMGDRSRDGKEVVQTITGTLPGKKVTDVLVVGQQKGTYDVAYTITDKSDQVRTITLTGPFYDGKDATYTLRLDHYGKHVEITKP